MMNQKDGVFTAVCSVTGQNQFDGAVELNRDQRKQICEIVAAGLFNGEISMTEAAREKYATEEDLRSKYVPGLLNNWIRKDLRLNGGTKYVAKNPGSRAGSGDKILRELKKLRATLSDQKLINKVDAEITKRHAELQAEKHKAVEIDVSVLPEHLQALVNC